MFAVTSNHVTFDWMSHETSAHYNTKLTSETCKFLIISRIEPWKLQVSKFKKPSLTTMMNFTTMKHFNIEILHS